ncbi:MAG: hypothetical protein U9Q33_06190 [Campylobacterota bacterium]|nr:hypothetical protein [Campylobacterota bacterium]
MNYLKEINEHFSRENIVKHTTSYILYYQVTLGNLVFETIQDMEETKNKLQQLNLVIDPNDVVGIQFMLFIDNINNIKSQEDFDELIKQSAITRSLNDFVQNDQELLNKDRYLKQKGELISKNLLFNSNMKMQFLTEYPILHKQYNNIIDDDYAKKVQDIIISHFS